jgi:hypothetical protein
VFMFAVYVYPQASVRILERYSRPAPSALPA